MTYRLKGFELKVPVVALQEDGSFSKGPAGIRLECKDIATAVTDKQGIAVFKDLKDTLNLKIELKPASDGP